MTWNRGGWFGAQIGGTLWMLVAALLLVRHDRVAAALGLGCFALPNAVGAWLWSRRAELEPYRATQALLACECLAALLAAFLFDWTGGLRHLSYGGHELRPVELYAAILVTFSFVSLQIWRLFGRRRGEDS
jgi:hypothetical protein